MEIQVLDKIYRAIEEDKIYKQVDINLYEFAKYLQLPQRKVSNLINRHFSMGFPALIQKHRLKEAFGRISENPKELILEKIARESGFSSRITFFKTFKKELGISPSEYVQKQKNLAQVKNKNP